MKIHLQIASYAKDHGYSEEDIARFFADGCDHNGAHDFHYYWKSLGSRPEAIKRVVADHFNMTIEDLCGEGRPANIVLARHVAMYLIYKYTILTKTETAEALSRKSHRAAVHAIGHIHSILETDPETARIIHAIEEKLPFKTGAKVQACA